MSDRAKPFRLLGRLVELERHPEADLWRVLVDGAPIPMTYQETESVSTNAGTYRKVLFEARGVEYASLGPCARAAAPFETLQGAQGPRALCSWGGRSAEIHNTAIYDFTWVQLTFSEALDRVAIEVVQSMDSSS